MTRATTERAGSFPVRASAKQKESLSLPIEHAKSSQNVLQGPRPLPSTAKSVKPEVSDGGEKSGLEVQKTLPLENAGPSTSVRENRLRRKQSSADNRSLYDRSKSQSSSRERPQAPSKRYTASLPDDSATAKHETILGISMPTVSQSVAQLASTVRPPTEFATSNSRMANFMSTQLPHKLSTHDLAPPTPGFTTKSSSASTRCSTTSPGPFSRGSTPTSASSCSPAIHLSTKRAKQTPSPARFYPPVTRRKGTDVESHELSALEESSIPSSAATASPEMMTSNVQKPKAPSNTTSSKPSAGAPVPPLRVSSKRLPRPKTERVLSTTSISSIPPAKMALHHERQDVGHVKPSLKGQASLDHAFENPRQPPPLPSAKQTPKLAIQTQGNQSDQYLVVEKHPTASQAKATHPTELRSESTATKTLPSAVRSPSTSSASKIPTRSPLINSNGVPAVKPPFRSVTPSKSLPLKPTETKKLTKSASRERTESPSKSTSRLNIFSRRTRQGSNSTDNAEPPFKKGPAAGTGHEGYGKYARRGRTSSIGTASSHGRSTSEERGSEFSYPTRASRKSSFASSSGSELDDFYKERLEPVVIRGGSRMVENRNDESGLAKIEREGTLTRADTSVESLPATKLSQRTPIKLGLPISPRDTDVMKRFPRRASMLQGDDDHLISAESPRPTLAARRSFNRSQNSNGVEPLIIPPPIHVSAAQVSPSLGSFETILSAAPVTDSSIFSDDILDVPANGSWSKARRLLDRAMPSKTSFFRRAQSSFNKTGNYQSEMEAQELFAAVTEVPDYRAVAHYCMLDDPDQEVKETLEDLLHEIEDDLELRRYRDIPPHEHEQAPHRQPSVLLPSPPRLLKDTSHVRATTSIKVSLVPDERSLPVSTRQPRIEPSLLSPKESEPTASPARMPRLTQVGRIPKIVSKKDHVHKPPARSFSRPFHREEYPSVANANPPAEKAVPKPRNVKSVEAGVENVFKERNTFADSALRFSPEKDLIPMSPRSGLSGSTSSSGGMDFSAITAVRPDSTASLDEDEIWNEYDELFDRATFPYTSATGFSLATDPDLVLIPKALATNYDAAQDAPMRKDPRSSDPISPKSTSRIYQMSGALSEFPAPPPQPSNAPDAIEYVEPKTIARLNSTSSRKSHHSHLSKTNSQSSRSSRRSTRPRTLSQILERKSRQSGDSVPHFLRYHAVMISQYLSFSRVLFSPIHTEVSTHMSERVLILDGLGNDDWSLYCALKYPEAIVYNLGASRPLSVRRRDSVASTSLPNHRQIQHVGIAHPFPFPKGFFAAVVWRFPTAGSEAAYYNAISEAKRVLRPGGYLELTVLDMDPVNMGNRARRAVRGLKVSMQTSNPDLSLAPVGDSIQKILGRKGFENLSRCVVGIPVVGGFGGSGPLENSAAGAASENQGFDVGTNAKDFSSLDDTSMLEMVGSVGRWWWGRCFEQWDSKGQATEETETRASSIWDEPALLRECEERETSFKLLLCYAQKPAVTRRRTVSV